VLKPSTAALKSTAWSHCIHSQHTKPTWKERSQSSNLACERSGAVVACQPRVLDQHSLQLCLVDANSSRQVVHKARQVQQLLAATCKERVTQQQPDGVILWSHKQRSTRNTAHHSLCQEMLLVTRGCEVPPVVM
jgi:hypothetical protein